MGWKFCSDEWCCGLSTSQSSASFFQEGMKSMQWTGFGASLALHSLALLICMLSVIGGPDRAANRAPRVIPLFVASPAPAESQPPLLAHLNVSQGMSVPMASRDELDPERVEAPIDMNSIQLSFADDVANELPEVVRMNDGIFALTEKADPGFARYTITPPDWTVRETLTDISGKIRLALYQPEKWNILRSVAQMHAIRLESYQAAALFGAAYNRCLADAIGRKARDIAPGGKGLIVSARLSFASGSECGIKVLEVSFAPVTDRKP
jgi:hypothetical protein